MDEILRLLTKIDKQTRAKRQTKAKPLDEISDKIIADTTARKEAQ